MFVKHDTNQMKRTSKYSGFSVNISALDYHYITVHSFFVNRILVTVHNV